MNTYALSIYEGKESRFIDFVVPKLKSIEPMVLDSETGANECRRSKSSSISVSSLILQLSSLMLMLRSNGAS